MCEECGCGHEHAEENVSGNKQKMTKENKDNKQNKEKKENEVQSAEQPKHKHKVVEVNRSLKEENDKVAESIASALKEKGIFCINLMGAPGAGKTTLIEGLAAQVKPETLAVIQGDLESDIDKERLAKAGIDCYQINTHSGCHLNSSMVNRAVLDMGMEGILKNKKYLMIENVGNLVCPAGVSIGQHMDIVVSATTEGSDKPKKYPIIFLDAKAVIISKYDIAENVGFDEKAYLRDIKNINSRAEIFRTSSKDKGSYVRPAHFISHERDHLLGHAHSH